jgi:hypothetical protein
MSLGAMLGMSEADLMATVAMAVYLQQKCGLRLPPHLVLLAHPWEFEITRGVPHASETNWERLEHIVETIAHLYPIVFTTMTSLVGKQNVSLQPLNVDYKP